MGLHKSSLRYFNFVSFLLCLLLLAASYYFEYVRGMTPCLLCLLQRWAVGILAILFLWAFIQNPKKTGSLIFAGLEIIVALLGIIAAGRQVWLQHQPPGSVTTCVPTLSFLLQTRPLPEVIRLMFHGGQDCAQVLWQWAGFTMAEWLFLIFIGLIIAIIIINSTFILHEKLTK